LRANAPRRFKSAFGEVAPATPDHRQKDVSRLELTTLTIKSNCFYAGSMHRHHFGRRAMKMDTQTLIVMAVVGIIAGFLASLVVGGSGILRYLMTGIIGSFVGGFVLKAAGLNLGIKNALILQIVTAAIGAIIVVILARIIA
jgi:uncharacterized membrane protein YeaQ/YmgE (transglycosylase-associated protein family)